MARMSVHHPFVVAKHAQFAGIALGVDVLAGDIVALVVPDPVVALGRGRWNRLFLVEVIDFP